MKQATHETIMHQAREATHEIIIHQLRKVSHVVLMNQPKLVIQTQRMYQYYIENHCILMNQ
jgi:hypothetical protein